MGYDVHITRAKEWFESKKKPITFDEWKTYIVSDPEMRLDGYAEAQVKGGGVLRVENQGLAVWTAYSGHGKDGNVAWFDHRGGEIVVKNPDEEVLGKMRSIAKKLGARVVGDEGEEY